MMMASRSDRAASHLDQDDALPRTDVDLESELEALRSFVAHGGPAPRNIRLWLNLDEFEAHLDHIVAILPKEVRRARRICREEQRLLQDARDEATRLLDEARAEADQIVTVAREEADRLVESSSIRQRAVEQAEAIREQAESTSLEIRQNSYNYASQVMNNVLTSLRRLGDSVETDRRQLEQMRPDAALPEPEQE
jgi:vacuolar-type H+-ATPase subunit H